MKIKTLLFLMALSQGSPPTEAMRKRSEPETSTQSAPKRSAVGDISPKTADTITLVSNDARTFKVPRIIALESNTLANIVEGTGETQEMPLPFDSKYLEHLSEILWAFYENRNLQHKKLFDAIDKKISFYDPIPILKIADYLDMPRLLSYAARNVIDYAEVYALVNPNLFAELASGTGIGQGLGQPALLELARYYYLRTANTLPEIETDTYGFSIREYLEYLPNIINAGFSNDKTALNLSNHYLQNLDGFLDMLNEFQALGNLQWLSLENNQLTQIDPGTFQGLTNLQWLSLEENKLTQIAPGTFQGLDNLKKLNLGYNNLTQIAPGIFQGLNNLETLILYGNELKQIIPGTFQGIDNLETLNLANNNLTQIAPGSFLGLDNLEDLFLSYNHLTQIDPETFQGLDNLEILRLNNNTLTQIAPDTFQELTNLRNLLLQNNELKEIDPRIFQGLDDLELINLSNNQLTQVTPKTFEGLDNLIDLELNDNELSDENKKELENAFPEVNVNL